MSASVHILGIRHHGPGSARSVVQALDEIDADCVLIEGPPDADELIAYAGREEMRPPVALLVYDAQTPARAVYYPFAEFSPEWQAMRWAIGRGVPVRFMDLPQSHRLAIDAERTAKAAEATDVPDGPADPGSAPASPPAPPAGATTPPPVSAPLPVPVPRSPFERDPLQQLARAAGFDDGERWWEHAVEHRRDGGLGMFDAIREAMAELRAAKGAAPPPPPSPDATPAAPVDAAAPAARTKPTDPAEAADPPAPVVPAPVEPTDEMLREAWMRRTIREARAGDYKSVAVVCGAWHAPALDLDAADSPHVPPAKADAELLKKLPKCKTAATWVPWTYDRLASASGYGAGIHSPGWYDHLWHRDDAVLESWMTRVAHLLREKDIDCSSAHVIEAVRLSTTLATLRGRPLADLSDVADATRSIFCFDSDLAMRLVERELLVGRRLGEVPQDTPMVPVQQDLIRLQKRLRLKPEAAEKELDLDLRNDNDRERSALLHRLRLLGIDWGTLDPRRAAGKGTFREAWQLRWDPSYAIKLVEAGALGSTVEAASGAALSKLAAEVADLRQLTAHLHDAMLAELGDAARALVRRIEAVAAVATDVALLMQTLPPLVSLVRYGNVRQTDEAVVRHMIDGLVPRVTAGLSGAVASLNDEAAAAMEVLFRSTADALGQLDAVPHTADWLDALTRILGQETIHGLIRGRCARLLLDAGRIDAGEVARQLSLTLSRGTDPAAGARWLEGFLRGSGLLLVHDEKLLGLIDDWVTHIPGDVFEELLPLLRRTFATFPAPERRQIGQMLTAAPSAAGAARQGKTDELLNGERAARALPALRVLLGL